MDTLPGGYLSQREADIVENRVGYISYGSIETVYDAMFQMIATSFETEDRHFFRRGRNEKTWDHTSH